MEQKTEDKIYRKAKARVKQMKDFYDHLFTFCIVLPLIIWADVNYTPDILWSIPALICWGTAIAIHWLFITERIPYFNSKWEERKIRELMEKDAKSGVHSSSNNQSTSTSNNHGTEF